MRAADKSVALRRVEPEDEIVELYLDVAGFPTWKALVCRGENYGLYLEPGFVAHPS